MRRDQVIVGTALTAAFVYRLTSSFAWTSITYLQTVLHAWTLCNEPGHRDHDDRGRDA